MVQQRLIPLDARSEWQEALQGVRHAFGHTWEHCHAMHLTTGWNTLLYIFECGGVRIVCPLVEREYGGVTDITKPFGFSGFVGNGAFPEFRHYWQEFATARGYVSGYLGLNPIFDLGCSFDPGEVFEYDTVYVLDLTQDAEALLAKMTASRRQQLKDWQEMEEHLVIDEPSLADFLIERYSDFLRSKNASSVYFFSSETLSFLLDQERVKLVGVREGGRIVAVNAFSYTADVGDGLFNISLPEARHFSAVTIWHAALALKSMGVQAFNLGGGGGGVADFKRRFGCEKYPLRCLKQVYRPELYEELCRQAAADPEERAGYFPAYRK